MVNELRLEGALRQEEDLEEFLDWLEAFAKEKKQQLEIYQDDALIKICPYGDISLQWEGKYLTFSSDASMIGPGYYDYVYHLLQHIKAESDLEWDLYDPCGYQDHQDFETLKFQYFYPFLTALKELALSNESGSPYLCSQYEDYLPMPKDDCAVTMMGYLSLSALRNMDVEAFAKVFYVWNEKGINAMYYRNCAQVLLWNRCYFEYSNMNGESMKTAEDIISYLEAAYEIDDSLPLFMHEYKLLCEKLNVTPVIQKAQNLSVEEIGYRHQLVLRQIEGWNVWFDGMASLFYDCALEYYCLNAPYHAEEEDWHYFVRFTTKQAYQPLEHVITRENVTITYQKQLNETEHSMLVQCKCDEQVISFEILAQEEASLDMILDWILLIEYLGGEA